MFKRIKKHIKDIYDVQKANQQKNKWKLKYKAQQEELLEVYRDEIKLLKKDNATRMRLSTIERKINLLLERNEKQNGRRKRNKA